jgi:hypothetical protein
MAQHDYVIDDGPGIVVRADFNAVLQAIISNNSGPLAPTITYPGMWWFDTADALGPGLIKIRTLADDDWLEVPTGNFLPISGGEITGDLNVAGIFSNPGFDALQVNHAGTSAPTDPQPGMLWFDTSVTPAVMRVRNAANSAWVVALPTTNPTFTDSVIISAAGTTARIDLIAAGETRSVVNDAATDRTKFTNPSGEAGYITDAGDFFLKALAAGAGQLLSLALNGKQANLGYTPVRQGAPTPALALSYSGRLGATQGGASLGFIYTTTDPPTPTQKLFVRDEIGSISFINKPSGSWPGTGAGADLPGSGLWFGWDGGHSTSVRPSGTWRNLSGGASGDINYVAQRVA